MIRVWFAAVACGVLVAVAVAFTKPSPETSNAGNLYENAVGLKPGEFARFNAEVNGSRFTVFVHDRKNGATGSNDVSKQNPNAGFRVKRLRVGLVLAERLRIRVTNFSHRSRRVRVWVIR